MTLIAEIFTEQGERVALPALYKMLLSQEGAECAIVQQAIDLIRAQHAAPCKCDFWIETKLIKMSKDAQTGTGAEEKS